MPEAKVCNMCGKELDFFDLQQDFTIHKQVCYGSIHDGDHVNLKLCCECFDRAVADCKVSPIEGRIYIRPDVRPVEPPRYTFTWGEPGWSAIEESILAGVDGMIRESIVSTVMGAETPTSSGTKKRVRQKKLTPADTKELDEFLGSFKILESAT